MSPAEEHVLTLQHTVALRAIAWLKADDEANDLAARIECLRIACVAEVFGHDRVLEVEADPVAVRLTSAQSAFKAANKIADVRNTEFRQAVQAFEEAVVALVTK